MHDQPKDESPTSGRLRPLAWTPALRRPTSDVRILLAGVGEAIEHLAAELRVRQLVARTIRLDLHLADHATRRQRMAVDPWTADESVLFRTARRLLARALDPVIWVARIDVRLDPTQPVTTTAPLFQRPSDPASDRRMAEPTREQRQRIARFHDQFGQAACSLVSFRR